MPRNGSGTYSPPAGQPVVSGTTVLASTFNSLVSDLSTEMTKSISTDGQTPMGANLPMGGFKVTGMAPGTTATDGVRYDQLTASSASSIMGFIQSGTGAVARTIQDSLRERVSGAQFSVDSTGATDSSTKFANASSVAQTRGTALTVSSGQYLINDASGFPDSSNSVPRGNIDMGPAVTFSGTVQAGNWFSVPCLGHARANGYNLITGSYEVSQPSWAFQDPGALGTYPFGHATRTFEVIPTTAFRGNADAVFAHATGQSGANASIGSVNMVTRLESGFLGDGNGFEVDIDNYEADRKGLGGIITGIGTHICEAGLKVTRGDTSSNWYYGVHVTRAKHGLYVDLTDEPSPVAAALLTGVSQNFLQMTPKDDLNPTNAAAYLTNANGSQVKFRLNKNGSVDSSSYLKATGDIVIDTSNLGVVMGTASGALAVTTVACIAADAGGYGTFNDLIIRPRCGSGSVGSIRFYGGASPTEQWRVQTDDSFRPGTDNTLSIGRATNRVSVVYAGTGTINTSDQREKQQIGDIDAAALRAVRRIAFRQFKFNDAVSEKGAEGARWHFGVIAQQVKEAFEAEGLDPFAYGLLCYDEWPETPEVRDETGNVIDAARPAGNRYGVRYEELFALKLAALEAPST